jgi:hypothetical protein
MRIPTRLRRLLKIAGAVVAALLLLLLIDQCWQVRRLGADQFIRKAENISVVSTTSATTYVGVAGDRVYLQYWQMGRWSRILYWTSLRELPSDLQEQLRSGDPPWKRFGDKPRQTIPGK